MNTPEINAVLALVDVTPQEIANAIKEDRGAVSQTINYLRLNKRLRVKIANHVGQLVAQKLFDAHKVGTHASETITRETMQQ